MRTVKYFLYHWVKQIIATFTWMRAKFPMIIFHMSLAVSMWPMLAWKGERHTAYYCFQEGSLGVWCVCVRECACVFLLGGFQLTQAIDPMRTIKCQFVTTKMLWSDPPSWGRLHLSHLFFQTNTHTYGLRVKWPWLQRATVCSGSNDPNAHPQWEDTNRRPPLSFWTII